MKYEELVKRLWDLDPILETEFDTQLAVERNPYGARKAIENAIHLLRDQSDAIKALAAENARLAASEPQCAEVKPLAWAKIETAPRGG